MKKMTAYACITIFLSQFASGCSVFPPANKPETGPTGSAKQEMASTPFLEALSSPPSELYDLETNAGIVFEGISHANWGQASAGLYTIKSIWQEAQNRLGEKKGLQEGNHSLELLESAIHAHNSFDSFEAINKYMSNISDIAKSYKLSPLSDIISVDNAIRNTSFYVQNRNWGKASAKVRELQSSWEQAKPSMEKLGILSQITRAHSTINQMKESVEAENEGKYQEQLSNINDSMGKIRDFFHGK